MGLYNYHAERLPQPLRDKRCFVCDSDMIPFNKDPELDGFQYKCNNCNPNIVIEISGSLLADSLYTRILTNQTARQQLQRKIRTSTRTSFAITTSIAAEYV